MRLSPLMLLSFLLLGCADTSAVTKFAQSAPDPSKLDALMDAYGAIPDALVEWDITGLADTETRQAFLKQAAIRTQQKANIDRLNTVLVEYMKGLGTLADSKLVDLTVSAKAVTDGLSSLQKADPSLGITSSEVKSVGDLITVVAGAIVSVWRQHELEQIITQAQIPFQDLAAVEKKIVQRGIIRDIEDVKSEIRRSDAVEMALSREARRGPASPSTQVAVFTLKRAAERDLAYYDNIETAAKAYVQALDALVAAHTKLYQDSQRNQLSKATLQQILPLVQQAEQAYTDLRKL